MKGNHSGAYPADNEVYPMGNEVYPVDVDDDGL